MECLPHIDVLDIGTHRLRPDLVALRAKLQIKSIGTLQKLRNRVLDGELEREINRRLPRWEMEVSKSHFLLMYDSSLRALDKLTLHQRERLNDIKCLDMVHLSAPAGAGKTFVAVERVVDALTPAADEPAPRVLYVAATVELVCYFVQWLAVRIRSQRKDLELLSGLLVLCKPYKQLLQLRMPAALQDGRIEFEAVNIDLEKIDKLDLLVIDESHNLYQEGVDRGIVDDLRCSKRLLLSDNAQSSAVMTTFPEMEKVQLTEVVRSTKQIVLGAASFQVNAEAAVPVGADGPPVKSFIFEPSKDEDARMKHYARRVMDAIVHVDNMYWGVSLHKRLALFVPDGQFLTKLKKSLRPLLRDGLPHRKFRFVKHEESLRSLPPWLRSTGIQRAETHQELRQEDEIVLDTIDVVDGLEHLIVICVGLDAQIQGEARDLVTRADLYKGLTRAQLLAIVVNEEVEDGWFAFLSNVRYEGSRQSEEEEAASKHQSHAAAKVWQAAADTVQTPAKEQETASEKPRQQKPMPSQPESTGKTKKAAVVHPKKVSQQVSNIWDTRSNEVSGPKKPAFDPLRAARVQARADLFKEDVEKLRGADAEAQLEAAEKLRWLAQEDFSKHEKASIAAAGAITPLVELLSGSTPKIQEAAADALWNLAASDHDNDDDNRVLIAEAGGIPALVELLRSSAPDVQLSAAGVLRNLALNANNKALIAEAGGIPPLVSCLTTGTEKTQLLAACALGDLMADWVFVDPEVVPMPEATEVAEANRALIAAAGAIPPLIALLISGMWDAAELAVHALRPLSSSEDTRVAIVEAGAIPVLAKFPPFCLPRYQHSVVGILDNLAEDAENLAAIVEAEAVPGLVELMGDASSNTKAPEVAAELLLKLCGHPQGLSEAKASGALGVAAQLEVSGTPAAQEAAKRLVALLRPGR